MLTIKFLNMKKLLLTLIVLLPLLCSAQSPIKSTPFGYKYYDKETKDYVTLKIFVEKYGEEEFVNTIKAAVLSRDITKEQAYSILNFKGLDNEGVRRVNINDFYMAPKQPDIPIKERQYKLKPLNLIIGSSIVATSAGGYMIATSAINGAIRKNIESMAEKEKTLASGYGGNDRDKILKDIEALSKKNAKLDKRKETAGYICGATSLAGLITILTGIYRSDNGIKVSQNTYINSTSQGLSASIVF